MIYACSTLYNIVRIFITILCISIFRFVTFRRMRRVDTIYQNIIMLIFILLLIGFHGPRKSSDSNAIQYYSSGLQQRWGGGYRLFISLCIFSRLFVTAAVACNSQSKHGIPILQTHFGRVYTCDIHLCIIYIYIYSWLVTHSKESIISPCLRLVERRLHRETTRP